MNCLLASADRQPLSMFEAALQKKGIDTSWVDSCDAVLSRIANTTVDVVVVDTVLSDGDGLACLRRIVSTSPFMNTAAISDLDDEVFHEETEGLGVLMKLPSNPQPADADRFLDHLNRVAQMTGGVGS